MILLVAERARASAAATSARWEDIAQREPDRWLGVALRLGAFREGPSAWRLRDLGLRWDCSLNLLPPSPVAGAWRPALADVVVLALGAWLEARQAQTRFILCGQRVAKAFADAAPLDWSALERPGDFSHAPWSAFFAPHPSGRSRVWNDVEAVRRIRARATAWIGAETVQPAREAR